VIFKKQKLIAIILMLCISALCLFTAEENNGIAVSKKIFSKPPIILDAGHAGFS
jgi:hypothetical protein